MMSLPPMATWKPNNEPILLTRHLHLGEIHLRFSTAYFMFGFAKGEHGLKGGLNTTFYGLSFDLCGFALL